MERKLAAILAADVVGYSGLMERDEAGTFERLRARRKEIFEPEVEKHHGRIFKLTGDGVLAEFASVVDAIECAVSVQRGMAERNANVQDDERIDIRIGINLGEIIVEGDDRYGEGVNVAARLEQLADPGGICVSGKVAREVEKKLAFDFEPMGQQRMKNIAEPVEAFRVKIDGARRKPMVRPPWSRRQRMAAAALPALLILAGGAVALTEYLRNPAATSRDRPSIAVLPFTNMSADPQQDYLADGISEDLITDLAKVSGLFVISRNSTFVYKGKAVVPAEVADALGVRYLLEGSLRRDGDRLRVNAQLIDTKTSGHLWADRYDRTMTDVFALQDDITRSIVAALQIELSESDQSRVAQVETADVRAYDAFLQGWELYRNHTPQGHAAAISYLEQAIAFDPSYGRAHAALALTYYEIADAGWSQQLGYTDESMFKRSRQQLDQAMQHHPTSTAHLLQGEWLRVAGRFDEAVTESERGVALDPSDSEALANLGNILISAGRAQDGLDAVTSAMRIDPHSPPFYLHYLAKAQFGVDKFADAAATWEEATRRNPDQSWWFVFLASAYGHLGRLDDAKTAVAKADAGFAGWVPRTTVLLASALAYKERADLDRLLDGLRKAGVPELPFDFDARARDQLGGDEIRALLFGHTVRGTYPNGSPFEMTRTADGAIAGTPGSETGRAVVEGNRLCDLDLVSGRLCEAVLRNPAGSAAERNEYIFVTPFKQASFSVTE